MTTLKLFIFTLISTPLFASTTAVLKPEAGQTKFLAIGKPAALKIRGEAPGPIGSLIVNKDQLSGSLKVPLQEFKTGISMRDEHMHKKYLESDKFPTAELKDLKVSGLSEDLQSIGDKDLPFEGNLELHGVTKPIKGTLTLKPEGTSSSVHAHFQIDLSDFSIDVPSYSGITVAKTVDVDIDTKAEVKK